MSLENNMNELTSFERKFQVKENLIYENNSFNLFLRPEQPVLGSLILSSKEERLSLAELSEAELYDFGNGMQVAERILNCLGAMRVNYLCLMLVDRLLHFHVIPRFSESCKINEILFVDKFWPKPIDINFKMQIDEKEKKRLIKLLSSFV